MPPRTRSNSQPRVPTPAAAPAPRVYKSSRPPQQKVFKKKTANIRKYGRRSLPENLRQETLTQGGYLTPTQPDLSLEELEMPEEEERPRKRRRISEEAKPSSFHTQTLTQLPSWTSSKEEEENEDLLLVKDSEDEALDDIYEVGSEVKATRGQGTPTSKRMKMEVLLSNKSKLSTPRGKKRSPLLDRSGNIEGKVATAEAVACSQTPTRIAKTEIPASNQSSPWVSPKPPPTPKHAATPMIEKNWTMPSKSPATNTDAPPPTEETILKSKLPRNLVIQDSFASSGDGSSQIPSNTTPRAMRSARSTQVAKQLTQASGTVTRSQRQPLAEIPFEIPDSDDEMLSVGPTPGKILETPSTKRMLAEVDLDDDAVPDGPATLLSVGPMPEKVPETPSKRLLAEVALEDEAVPDAPATPTPVTRKVASAVVEGSSPGLKTPTALVSKTIAISSGSLPRHKTPAASASKVITISSDEPSSVMSTMGPRSVTAPRSAMISSEPVHGQVEDDTPISSPHDSPSPSLVTTQRSPAKTQFDTQFLESQRLPLDVMQSFAPITDRSDIIISILPRYVAAITAGRMNHEFRSYRIPHTVSRFWIYTSRPQSEMRYMAVVSHAKVPGEIDSNSGDGNANFNLRKYHGKDGNGGFAYELIQVYELNNPVSLNAMKANGWAKGPPQRYNYVPPAVVGHLLGNLRCALFETPGSDGHLTISQELAEQLIADVEHTQAMASDGASDAISIPSSQKIGKGKKPEVSFALPTLPPTRTSARTTTVRPSQATTVSQPSTQAQSSSSPGKSDAVGRPSMGSSIPSVGDFNTQGGMTPGGNSLLRESQLGGFAITSSQASLMGRMFATEVDGLEVISDSDDGDLDR